MLSRKGKYGLKAVLRLANEYGRGPMLVSDLARREAIPRTFLEQILLQLKHAGFLQSRKGKGGGYLLGRPPEEITVGEIVRILDGPIAPVGCVSLMAYTRCPECRSEATCGVRMVMKEVRDATARILDTTSLADVSRAVARMARISDEARLVGGASSTRPGAGSRPGALPPAGERPSPALSRPLSGSRSRRRPL